jgi:AcrR family transcriptional regulator
MSPRTMPLPASPFLERLVRFLTPYFAGVSPDPEITRLEILETIEAYGARTRAELLNVVQIIAFSMSVLDVLYEASTTEMSASMRLRARGCANNLDRSFQKNEQALSKRFAGDPPNLVKPAEEPIDDLSDFDVDEAIQHAQAAIARHRAGFAANPAPDDQLQDDQLQDAAIWAAALAQAGMPAQQP